MSNSKLDKVLLQFSYESLEFLQRFGETPNFPAVAYQTGSDERTVKRRLNELDDAFYGTRNVHLLESRGRGQWAITPAGIHLVNVLKDAMDAMRTAPDLVAGIATDVRVTCSKNALSRLAELRDALPKERTWSIVPDQKRTSEIHLEDNNGSGLYLYSILMSTASVTIERGEVLPLNGLDGQFLPLSVEPIRMLAPRSIGGDRVGTVRDHIERRVVFIMPRGGVVWDYVNKQWPDWAGLKPGQHRPVTDLDAGLELLTYDLVPYGAMLVHGFDEDDLPGLGGDLGLFDLADDDKRWRAVTGLFRVVRNDFNSTTTAATDQVWRTAVNLWGRGEERP